MNSVRYTRGEMKKQILCKRTNDGTVYGYSVISLLAAGIVSSLAQTDQGIHFWLRLILIALLLSSVTPLSSDNSCLKVMERVNFPLLRTKSIHIFTASDFTCFHAGFLIDMKAHSLWYLRQKDLWGRHFPCVFFLSLLPSQQSVMAWN